MSFDPEQFLSTVNGRQYLEVKWRLVWLRTEQPDAEITTKMEKISAEHAIFSASVALQNGASATGWAMKTPADHHDYLETAETAALGRALGALGFGTQFAFDHESDQVGHVVDSPVPVRQQAAAPRQQLAPQQQAQQESSGPRPSTPRQHQYIKGLAEERGYDAASAISDAIGADVPLDALTSQDASQVIKFLQAIEKPAF